MVLNLCANCNKETSNPKFCSRSCAATVNCRLFPKRKLKTKCKHCDTIVRNYRSELCEKHFVEYRESRNIGKYTLEEYQKRDSMKGKHPSWRNAHVRVHARNKHKKLLKSPCKNCGYKLHVELCHIKPLKSFKLSATLDEVNAPENVVQLCRNCHWEFDNKLLALSD